MFQKCILFVLISILIGSCREKPRENGEAAPSSQAEVRTEQQDSQGYSGETNTSWNYCFVSRTAAPKDFGDAFNYSFLQFHVEEDGQVTGTMVNAPYGTDGSRGSFKGIYQEEGKRIQTTLTYLAEGELYEEQRTYEIREEGIEMLDEAGDSVLHIPSVSCDQYNTYFREFQQGILSRQVNTTDRTRLKKVQEVLEFGYSEAQLDGLRFMEVPVDLDRDYGTEEYLLYIMDPMVCGSGGCNLLVIDGKGKTLSSTTVVKLPVYTSASTINDMEQKGSWKPLFVWSQGFRELTSGNGKYPGNASMAPQVPEESLSGHPEKYVLLLDYLD